LKERLFDGDKPSKQEIVKLEGLLDAKIDLDGDTLNSLLKKPLPSSIPAFLSGEEKSFVAMGLWIRMLFSGLVDADYLDTERFMNEKKYAERSGYASLEDLKRKFDVYIGSKIRNAKKTQINVLRSDILTSCREKAKLKPGFFTLSVPTGAGKTLASMAFALDHALYHGKKRIIMAIPYTSIIEQTASVFKYGTDDKRQIDKGAELFGELNVVEHHSSLDSKSEKEGERATLRNKLSCENWDAPIIVTTNVQLFESLAAAKPSKCRKLHNIANSVIILDETQMLPPEFFKSIVKTLEHLVEHFNVTVLLCTATQPALQGKIGTGTAVFDGLKDSTELISQDRKTLHKLFKRVRFYLPSDEDQYDSWNKLSKTLCCYESVLCVVNTRKSARDLHSVMPHGTMHLSGLMCAEDRSDVISEVKERLKNRQPIRLISTQLIEAGVDIDFPIVFRSYAGIDSIVQAAGRCNREGRLRSGGKVMIFNSPTSSPSGLLRKGEDAAHYILDKQEVLELSDDMFERYFKRYYSTVTNFDKPDFAELMLKNSRKAEFQFRTYSKNYRMIDNKAQKSIIIPYMSAKSSKSSLTLIEDIENEQMWGVSLFRRLQRFIVTLPGRTFDDMSAKGYVKIIDDGDYGVLRVPELYRPGTGLILDDPKWEEALFV